MSWTRFRVGLLGLLLILPALPAGAQPTAGGLSARLNRLPTQWFGALQGYQERSLYAEDVLHRLIVFDFDGHGLDEADLAPAERKAERAARSEQLEFAFSYDLDGDGRTALSEARTAIESEDAIANSPRSSDNGVAGVFHLSMTQSILVARGNKTDPVSRLQRLDRNGDGIVAFDEARRLSPETRAAVIAGPVQEILAILPLDPTGDRHITEAEMTEIAATIFAAFDWDADGKLSDAERANTRRYLPPRPPQSGGPVMLLQSKVDLRCLLKPGAKLPCPPGQ